VGKFDLQSTNYAQRFPNLISTDYTDYLDFTDSLRNADGTDFRDFTDCIRKKYQASEISPIELLVVNP